MDTDDLLLTIAETAGHARHIRVVGDLDVETSTQLAEAIKQLVDTGIALVVLDLVGVNFADSSGLRVIVHAGNQLEDGGGSLIIEGMSPAVERLLQLTGVIDRYRREQ